MHRSGIAPALGLVVLASFAGTVHAAVPSERTSLPVVHIRTGGEEITEEGISAILGIADSSSNGFLDSSRAFSGRAKVEVHGHSSSWFPKKSYEIGLRDTAGKEAKASLLGMSRESGWMLIASYTDKSCLRNAFGYAMSRAAGRYAPRARFVEVVVDSSYDGIYLLTEKIQRSDNRVAVHKLDSSDTAGPALEGGYILRIDRDDANGWWSSRDDRVYYQHYYPKIDKIRPQQLAYIRGFVEGFESMMASDTFARSGGGYHRWIDEGSFQDFLLLQELVRNIDGYRMSSFLSKDRDSLGGKLQAGPVWDLDLAGGLPDYFDGWKVDGWEYQWDARANNDGGAIPFWWPKLANETGFRSRLGCRWKSLRRGEWSDSKWNARFDSLRSLASGAQSRNFQRWPILNEQVWPEKYVAGSWTGEVDTLRNWLRARIRWIDSQFPNCTDGISKTLQQPGLADFRQEGDRLVWDILPKEAWISDLRGAVHRLPISPVVRLEHLRGILVVRWTDGIGTGRHSRLIRL